ncbi:MAG TPA: DUF5683 domain-containing protein [Ignavibacteriales bacterium]|nr:DUF5683 domain-containing protein [Ignavibacteriales bacterium]
MRCSRSSAKIIISIILFLVVFAGSNFAQTDTTQTQPEQDSAFVLTKSPWGAVLSSAIVPGLGQIYNESYWKAPVVWGFMGYFLYIWIDNNKDYKFYRNLYNQIQYDPNFTEGYKNNIKVRYRDFYHDQRDQFAIYLGLTYVLNLLDAYVDAHLFDFSVEEEPFTGSPRLNLRINF